jgi:hypothetical protein
VSAETMATGGDEVRCQHTDKSRGNLNGRPVYHALCGCSKGGLPRGGGRPTRRASVLNFVVGLTMILAGSAPTAALETIRDASALANGSAQPLGRFEALAVDLIEALPPDLAVIELGRITLPPGGGTLPGADPGPSLNFVERGAAGFELQDPSLRVRPPARGPRSCQPKLRRG